MNTKLYPQGGKLEERPEACEEVRGSIQGIVNDPITKLLLSSSHLTIPQLETLLADSISHEKASKKEQRRLFRPSRRRLSRGAYNRSLIQAQNNVIRSIYTILLLGYVGLFDSPALQPFLELADGLRGYTGEAKGVSRREAVALNELKTRLWETISALAGRGSFKDSL